jgi:hypothetical protein
MFFFNLLFNDVLSVSGLCSACDRMINEYGAAGGMKIGR